jgi:hypothetical protein
MRSSAVSEKSAVLSMPFLASWLPVSAGFFIAIVLSRAIHSILPRGDRLMTHPQHAEKAWMAGSGF